MSDSDQHPAHAEGGHTMLPVNLSGLAMVYLFLAVPMLVSGSAGLLNLVLLLVFVCGAHLAGASLLMRSAIVAHLLPLSHTALSVLFGGLLFAPLIFFTTGSLSLAGIILAVSLAVVVRNRQRLAFTGWPHAPSIVLMLSAIVAICMVYVYQYSLYGTNAFAQQFSAVQEGTQRIVVDNFYYTAIVSSVRKGTIFSASYEVGSPLNYQLLGFLIPSLVANVLNISSHQALWGLSMPFYKLVSGLLGYELLYFMLRYKVSRHNHWFIVAACLLPVLLAPFDILALFHGEMKKLILNGMGYLTPAGPIAIDLLFFCMLLFMVTDWKGRKQAGDKILFVAAMSLISIGKLPVFMSYLVFVAAIVAKRVVSDKEKVASYLGWLAAMLVSAAILYRVCIGQENGGRFYLQYGYLAELFTKKKGISHMGPWVNIGGIAAILLMYLYYLNIRLVGLTAFARSSIPYKQEYLLGGCVSLIFVTLLASFLHIEILTTDGRLLVDNTFNVQQFITASFYLLSVPAIAGTLYLLFGIAAGSVVMAARLLVAGWCMVALLCIFWPGHLRQSRMGHMTWYDDNYAQLKEGRYSDGLIAVNPHVTYPGILLAASDYGTYWTAMDRSAANYNSTNMHQYRWALFRALLDSPKAEYLQQMKNEGVRYIIATPFDTAKFMEVCRLFPASLCKVEGSRWVFSIK